MREKVYNREESIAYARKWSLSRNPKYYNFDGIGGDCTNFVSQCIYAGAKVMNYTSDTGWYYRSINDRSAAWSGVEYLYKFLVNNKSVGPYGHTVSENEIEIGDVIQLGGSDGRFYHSLVVTQSSPAILIACHTYDSSDRPLYSYNYSAIRFIHIDGVRVY